MKKLTVLMTMVAIALSGAALFSADYAVAKDKQEKRSKDDRKRPGFADCDKNGDGVLSLKEFEECHPRSGAERFKEMDKNHDGKVTKDEMKNYYDGRRSDRKREYFDSCDKNKDGQLSFTEFEQCKPAPKKK